jgi:hypothetical protein
MIRRLAGHRSRIDHLLRGRKIRRHGEDVGLPDDVTLLIVEPCGLPFRPAWRGCLDGSAKENCLRCPVKKMNCIEQFVQRDQHRIHVREYAGEGRAVILMRGFPANLHLYDRLGPGSRSAPRASRSKIEASSVGCDRQTACQAAFVFRGFHQGCPTLTAAGLRASPSNKLCPW